MAYGPLPLAGGATALIMAARGEVLLRLGRPCAAIRDACAALQMNADCAKAYHIRGAAHHRLQCLGRLLYYLLLSRGIGRRLTETSRKAKSWTSRCGQQAPASGRCFSRLPQDDYGAMHAFVTKKAGVEKAACCCLPLKALRHRCAMGGRRRLIWSRSRALRRLLGR